MATQSRPAGAPPSGNNARVTGVADDGATPGPPVRGARAVARVPEAPALILSSLVAAIPAGATGLLLILHVRDLGGSYAFAGLVAGAYAFGAAASAPLVGRTVDRFGQTAVLLATMVLTAAALVLLALLPDTAPDWTLVALATFGGLVHPPVGACTRTLLPAVVRDPHTLHAAYALESSALEASYIAGPLLIGGLVAPVSTRLALVTAAVVLVVGTTWFLTRPASRTWSAAPDAAGERRSRLGALASPGVRVLLLTITAFSVSFGAIEVSVTAFAADLDATSAAGPLLAAWGLGSLVGGVLFANARAPEHPARRLVAVLAVLAAGDALLVLTSGSWVLAAILPLSGLAIAPAFAVVHAMAGVAATKGTSVEAFAWLGTGVSAGFALGAALAGSAADAGGPAAAFGTAAGAVGAAIAVFVLGWARVGGFARAAVAAPADALPAGDPR